MLKQLMTAIMASSLIVQAGCSLKDPPPQKLAKVTLGVDNSVPRSMIEAARGASPEGMIGIFGNGPTPPSLTNGFSCMGFNIVGPGITPSSSNTNQSTDTSGLISGSSYCTYPGVTSTPILPGQSPSLTVSIPTGASRVVQAIGIMDSSGNVCSASGTLASSGGGGDNNTGYYDLGHVVVDIFTDVVINVPNIWDSIATSSSGSSANTAQIARQANCGGGNNSGSNGGTGTGNYTCSSPATLLTNTASGLGSYLQMTGTTPYSEQAFVATATSHATSITLTLGGSTCGSTACAVTAYLCNTQPTSATSLSSGCTLMGNLTVNTVTPTAFTATTTNTNYYPIAVGTNYVVLDYLGSSSVNWYGSGASNALTSAVAQTSISASTWNTVTSTYMGLSINGCTP